MSGTGAGAKPGRRRRWPWVLLAVVMVAVVLNLAGVTPYSILMHNDDHAGISRTCPDNRTTVAQGEQRSTQLLDQATKTIVAADVAVGPPRFDTQAVHGRAECYTTTGIQDVPDGTGPQANLAARVGDLWTKAGYQKLSATEFRTADGYLIALNATTDGRLWLSTTSPSLSP